MDMQLWHGTNQTFDRFDREMLGLNTSNDASRAAFFFAVSRDTAWDYAHQAARNLVPGQMEHEALVARILADADRALSAGRHDAYEELILEAEDLEAAAMQADPQGAKILSCKVSFTNSLEVSGWAREVVNDLGWVLEQARLAGHDAVILNGIVDTPSGGGEPDTHVAVFDPAQIEILDVFEHCYDPAPAEQECAALGM